MLSVRRLLAQRRLAMLLCLAVLLLKLLAPGGDRLGGDEDRTAARLGAAFAPETVTIAPPDLEGDRPDLGRSEDHGKADMLRACSGLSAAMTGAIDPIQLAALIAWVMAVGVIAVLATAPSPAAYLRPPLRGPPATL